MRDMSCVYLKIGNSCHSATEPAFLSLLLFGIPSLHQQTASQTFWINAAHSTSSIGGRHCFSHPLFNVARRALSLVPSSASVERANRCQGKLHSKERNRLLQKRVNALMKTTFNRRLESTRAAKRDAIVTLARSFAATTEVSCDQKMMGGKFETAEKEFEEEKVCLKEVDEWGDE